jgi:hypothetical protein
VPVFYIWFGPTLSIYVMALIISLFITVFWAIHLTGLEHMPDGWSDLSPASTSLIPTGDDDDSVTGTQHSGVLIH